MEDTSSAGLSGAPIRPRAAISGTTSPSQLSVTPQPSTNATSANTGNATVLINAASAKDISHINTLQSHPQLQPEQQHPHLQVEGHPRISSADATIIAESRAPVDAAMTDAAPYGTRASRRTGASRPNYAEDQDHAMDYQYTAAPKAEPSRTATPAESKHAMDTVNKAISLKTEKTATKDSGPGASSSSHVSSKKRKAVTGTSTPDQMQVAQTITSNAIAAASRRHALSSGVQNRPETNLQSFDQCKARLNKDSLLVADDGTTFAVNDHIYMVCEPPGEPYYLGRIMQFMHTKSDDPTSPIDALRVNWFYRPRDVGRSSSDTRVVYGTMHSDISPLTSLRGKCQISHRSEIANLDEYRKGKDCFWFSQIFDRFIRRFYEVIPTSDIINVPDKVKKALDERWRFVAVEPPRLKELTSAVKLCKRCTQYCASNDSVECADCLNNWHLLCVKPPLPKKPSRGFGWTCGPCTRTHELRMEARRTPQLGLENGGDEEILEEEEEDPNWANSTRAPSQDPEVAPDDHPGTQAEVGMARMWTMRYFGIHCKVEDALQYDDRAIYPVASSRLGPRHQATVAAWPGRPFELVKPVEIKKKTIKTNSHKKDAKYSKETLAAIEADRVERANRPKWVIDEPKGYVPRGEDYPDDDPRNTAQIIFRYPEEGQARTQATNEAFIDGYMNRAKALSKTVRVADHSVNFQDKCLSMLTVSNYNVEAALAKVAKLDRGKDLNEPIFTSEDLRKFEEGVEKYGSEHRLIKQHMKTNLPISSIIRFYYLWKKTPRGRQIWDNYGGGRKGSKLKKTDTSTERQTDIADAADDSAFDGNKAIAHKREFECKFCHTRHARQWRRAPGVAAGQTVGPEGKGYKGTRLLIALCLRCAGLWRRYAIQWEDIDEVSRKIASSGGKGWKRKIDEELLRELEAASELAASGTPDPAVASSIESTAEPAKKKAKTGEANPSKAKAPPAVKLPTPPPPPIVPDEPKWRALPCAVCKTLENANERPISCTHCKLTVHKQCYGLTDHKPGSKWVCDQCTNDRNPTVSTEYQCTLCPIEFTPHELWEAPKTSHKKKTDRDREKERMEKALLDKAKQDYTSRQNELCRPVQPREPLKRTGDNNWVHVMCAVWTPEVKFSDARLLERSEGISSIPSSKWEATCKLCKDSSKGACVSCQQCHANVHVACAFEAGYTFGFDVLPVKGSRKDQFTTVTLGQETGSMTAAIWCRDHSIKTIVHSVDEVVDDQGKTALQLYVENYKQADQTLTGTARKANLLSLAMRGPAPQTTNAASVAAGNRRVSTVSVVTGATGRKGRNSLASIKNTEEETDGESPVTANAPESQGPQRKCVNCRSEISPRWYSVEKRPVPPPRPVNGLSIDQLTNNSPVKAETNGDHPTLPSKEVPHDQQDLGIFECHKCHLKDKLQPRSKILLSPSRTLPQQIEWPPSTLPPPPQPQNIPPAGWPEHGPYVNGPSNGGSGGQFPPPGEHHFQPLQRQPNAFAPPPPMQSNGLSFGQPPRQAQPFNQPNMNGHFYDRPPPLSNAPSGPQQPQTNGPLPTSQYPIQPASFAPPPQPSYPPRNTDGPFQAPQAPQAPMPPSAAPPPPQQQMANQGSPLQHPMFPRASTPRENSIDPRLSGGASASPSLRNLLH